MRVRRTIGIAALLCLPVAAMAFETTEDILWPERGRFLGYPPEPDPRPYQFSVSGGIYHDDNILRLPDNDPRKQSDTVYRAGLGFKADLPISQQRVLLDAKVDNYNFDRNSVLDHVAYQAGAAWKWQVTRQLTGDVGYARRRFLGDLGEIQARIKDMVDEDRFYASAGFLLTPRWRIRGAADWLKSEHSEPTREVLDRRVTSGTIGLDYVTPANNSIGGQFKVSHGDYPNREAFPGGTFANTYDEYETSAVLRWILTGKSVLGVRLGYTKREHDEVPARDFDGATGRVTFDWAIAGKTLANFSVWREIRSVEEGGTLEQAAASYVLSTGASVGPAWAPTSKLVFQALLVHEKRDYQGTPDPAFFGAPQREDTFNGLRLSAGYTPRRNIYFSLSAERGERTSNIASREYDFNRVSANARLAF